MSDCPYRVPCTFIGPDNSEARQKKALPSSFLPLSLGSGGLEPLIVLCFGDALFNEPFTIASPFVILILTGSHWHFVTCRAMHRIPAFGFGR